MMSFFMCNIKSYVDIQMLTNFRIHYLYFLDCSIHYFDFWSLVSLFLLVEKFHLVCADWSDFIFMVGKNFFFILILSYFYFFTKLIFFSWSRFSKFFHGILFSKNFWRNLISVIISGMRIYYLYHIHLNKYLHHCY